jgi:hypothetical protein
MKNLHAPHDRQSVHGKADACTDLFVDCTVHNTVLLPSFSIRDTHVALRANMKYTRTAVSDIRVTRAEVLNADMPLPAPEDASKGRHRVGTSQSRLSHPGSPLQCCVVTQGAVSRTRGPVKFLAHMQQQQQGWHMVLHCCQAYPIQRAHITVTQEGTLNGAGRCACGGGQRGTHWLPLVLGPALAMDRQPAKCCMLKFSSLNLRP